MKSRSFALKVIIASITVALVACGGSGSSSTTTPPTPTPTNPGTGSGNGSGNGGTGGEQQGTDGVTAIPSSLSGTYTAALNFDRYTKVDAPNGKAIHILVQNQITHNQVIRARNVLQHYLANYPGSRFGEDKSAVANKMADNGATLLLLNGVDDGTNPGAEMNGQPLYFGEMQVEGHAWYINQDYEHRDATFEEILHLVHDFGIGVDQNPTFTGALPDFQAEIRAAQVSALSGGIWAAGQTDWINELTAENSLSQEYLASVIDAYYGLWGAHQESPDASMWGFYHPKVRTDLVTEDPEGAALMDNSFFHPWLTYNARIDESFTGNFSLTFDANLPYTHHAQYLKDVTLTGSNPSGVIVNQLANNITGNDADNTATFHGPQSEYQIEKNGDTVTVSDQVDNRDNINTLINIETLAFTDGNVQVSDL